MKSIDKTCLFTHVLIVIVLLALGAQPAQAAMPGAFGGALARLAVDASGNVYVVGTSDAAWLGASPVRAFQGSSDAFVAKLDPNGALQWFTFLGGASADHGGDIAVRGSDVFVVGTSYAAWGTSPTRAYTALNDAFVAKLNAANGALQWHAFLGGAGDDYGNGIALDTSGNVYLAGTSSATWGATIPRIFTALHDAFAAKLNANGALQWTTFLGGAGIDEGADIATDGNANVYVVGASDDTWGTSPLRAYTAGWDAFAAELNSDGALQWHTFLGDVGQDRGYAIVADAGGDNIYAAGGSTATWGAPQRAYSAWWDGFAVKLNGSGALQWNTFLGSTWSDTSNGIVLDGSGNVFVAGAGDAEWGAPVGAYSSGYDVYAVKLDPSSGALQMLSFAGGWGDDFGGGIALDPSGNILLAGVNDVVWGEPVQSYGDAPNAFALKLNAEGELQWNTFLGGAPYALYLPLVVKGFSSSAARSPMDCCQGLAMGAHFRESGWARPGLSGQGTGASAALAAGHILNYGSDGDDTQIDLGTPDPDTILQYGRGGKDTQYATGSAANDWIEQDGGDGNDTQNAIGGTDNDYIFQSGGNGDDTLSFDAGTGENWLFQSGGVGNDDISGFADTGNDYLYLSGGWGNETMKVYSGRGDDLVRIAAGSGTDTIDYTLSDGADQVFIDGGTGNDTLTVRTGGQPDFTLLDAQGNVLYQQGTGGTVITMRNVEHGFVIDPDEVILFQW